MNDIVKKYSQIYGSPFLVWVMMWVNAIKDAALYVDWPDCIFYKADMIFKTHDIFSKLKEPSIDTKLYFSGVMPNKMVRWYDDKIKKKLSFIDENSKFNLWVVTCMPVTWLLAVQYDNIYSDFKKDFIFVPSFTDKFRLDWYSIFLKELSKKIYLDANKEKQEKHISIIWFLFDRNEWDTFWNIEEIKRILSLLWIFVDCIWLEWENYNDLKKVENSELLVSLPNWELASKILSKRLDVENISVNIPFWLEWTIIFLNVIWEKLWIDSLLIKQVISQELKIIKNKINSLDEKAFLNKNYLYAWDPFLENGIKDIWNYLWMNHIKTYNYTWSSEMNENDFWGINIDLVIWNSEFSNWTWIYLEFWFPSYNTHFLTNKPYMWFNWFLNFVERLYNEVNRLR